MNTNIDTSWRLSDLFNSFESALKELDNIDTESFEKKWKGNLTNNLLTAITEYEGIEERLKKVGCYAFLNYSVSLKDQNVSSFYQKVIEAVAQKSKHLVFFTLELASMEDIPHDPNLLKYSTWIKHIRAFRPYYLSSELEKFLLEKNLSSKDAWIKLYDETLASIAFDFDGKKLGISEITDLISHEEGNVREKAALSLSKGLEKNMHLFTSIMNALLKDNNTENNWRKFDKPESFRHVLNDTTQEIVDSLVSACEENYKNLSHKYYDLKAKALKKDKLKYYDRNAPLELEKPWTFSFEQAKDIVLKAYFEFDPKIGEIAKKFFDNDWIDYKTSDSKMSGAFSCSTPVHPYILMNFQGKVRDVMTLAHELGHGVHQYLSKNVGELQSDTPLTIAETASVFGEMLTFQSLYTSCDDSLQKRYLLAAKIDDKLNTVVRQIAFFQFERIIHEKRSLGEISKDDFYKAFLNTQEKALGPSVVLDEVICPYFSYISHFYHSPFYVYAYAFGDCLVNSLYSRYTKSKEGFVTKYIDLLSKGGSLSCDDLLKPFDIDLNDKKFWNEGLSFIESLIIEFEKTF